MLASGEVFGRNQPISLQVRGSAVRVCETGGAVVCVLPARCRRLHACSCKYPCFVHFEHCPLGCRPTGPSLLNRGPNGDSLLLCTPPAYG